MSRFILALIGAAAISLIAPEHSSAAGPDASNQKVKVRAIFSGRHKTPECVYHCPPGKVVCVSEGIDPRTGCPFFHTCQVNECK
jgi:hypothetical protein